MSLQHKNRQFEELHNVNIFSLQFLMCVIPQSHNITRGHTYFASNQTMLTANNGENLSSIQ